MFKIGDFSFISGIPVKTLRYYDEIGLLRPAQVDRLTGYRYYAADQFERLNRIVVFKDLGLSLEQIKHLLDENLSTPQVIGMLRLRYAQIQQEIDEGHARLARIELHIERIQQEGKMPELDVNIKKLEPQTILSMREVVPTLGQMGDRVGAMFNTIFGFIGQNGVKVVGPSLVIYHGVGDQHEYQMADIDTECAGVVNLDGANVSRHLPDGVIQRTLESYPTVTSYLHKGDKTLLTQSWQALGRWIAVNGYRIIGSGREIYLVDFYQIDDRTQHLTEIQFPVERV